MSPEFGGKPWSLVHHACVKSAVERIRPKETYLYYEYEPTGAWWELTRNMVTLEKVDAPREIFGNALVHPAHRADVVRLEKLLTRGGIYLDADVFVHRSFDNLLWNSTVLGQERVRGRVVGLCNAVMMAESGAPFLRRWHSEYRSFHSKGHDSCWDEHSVRIPYRLSTEFPEEVTVLPESAFFWPTFTPDHLSRIFASIEPIDLSASYATHLWESPAWWSYLEYLTPRKVRMIETNFHRWVRPMIEGLDDDYGKPNTLARLKCGVQHFRRRARAARRLWTGLLAKGIKIPSSEAN